MPPPDNAYHRLAADCPDWPADLAQRYCAEGYWQQDTLAAVLDDLAKHFGDRIAIVDATRQVSYATLAARSRALAAGLQELGLARGDCAVLQLPNRITFVETLMAMARIGAIPVMALPAHRALEIGQFCRFTAAKALVIADHHAGFDYRALARDLQADIPTLSHVLVDGIPQPPVKGSPQIALDTLYRPDLPTPAPVPAPGDVALFQISGGTTGLPKLIPRRHHEYLYNMRCAADASRFDVETRFLCALPVAHNFPFACPGLMGALLQGARIVMADTPDSDTCFSWIAREGVTHCALVPPMVQMWLRDAPQTAHRLDSLRVLQVGGSRLSDPVARRIRPELDCALQQVFGMAEGLICFTDLDDDPEVVCTTQGRPMSPGDEVRIVDRQGRPVPDGTPGLLQVRGPYTMRGYFRMPEKNAESFTPDGYYVPGDLVVRTPGGHLSVVGRAKEQINRGGEKLSGEELENILLRHPNIHQAAVVGLPDPLLQERICAFVIPTGEAPKPLALKRLLREAGVAAYKMPDEFRFLHRFPATGVGKTDKASLREALRAHSASDPTLHDGQTT